MLRDNPAFSGFSVTDMAAAKQFYGETLGLNVDDTDMGLKLNLSGGGQVFIYEKADHTPASFTVLNFVVTDIDKAVSELIAKNVSFEHYEGLNGDSDIARGRAAGMGPDIAWFKDPAGNILSVLQND